MRRLVTIRRYLNGIPLSYAQIYFSNSTWLGTGLLLITFFDPGIGASGLLAIVICQVCSRFFSFSRASVFDGAYTYNALLTGLALGSLYEWSSPYFAVLVLASLLSFFLTVWIGGRLGSIGLPFLTLPFLITIWVLQLGLPNFSGIQLHTRETFSLAQWLPGIFTGISSWIDRFALHDAVHIYLRSLSAVLFQYNDIAGCIIALLLLLRSRMAFMLSLYGFGIGFLFFRYFNGDFTLLISSAAGLSYTGFNFILTAVALGGFFIVPSAKSHLLLLFVIPVTVLLNSALAAIFIRLNLTMYSLPFNIVVLLMIGVLQMRQQAKGLQLVVFQQYSPEANHYKHIYYQKRFAGQQYYHLQLPFMGEWYVSQGYSGSITHREEWRHALDFDIRNDEGKTYRLPALENRDFFCYESPVTAPAAGIITTVKDGVRDNRIGEINLDENWGNTIIIKVAEGLYTKLSHLKPGTLKVAEGDTVRAGEYLAQSGSSGRSPEPHLHFQVQAFPYIGSQTLAYPLAYYLVKKEQGYSFHSFETPKEGETVRNVIACPLMANAFGFIAGKELEWQVTEADKMHTERWNVYVDIYNKTYLYCNATKAIAYFVNDGVTFYFTDFYGSRQSFLYRFYIAFHKILLGCYSGASLSDWLLPQTFFHPLLMAVQDVLAPFVHFTEGRYQFAFGAVDNYHQPEMIQVKTTGSGRFFGKKQQEISGDMSINNQGISNVIIHWQSRIITASCGS